MFEAIAAEDFESILSNVSQINLKNEAGDTPLLVAVQKRQLKVVKVLLEQGADKEAANKEGKTALHIAVKQGRSETVSLLLDHGANIEARDSEGNAALLLVVTENLQLPIAKLLVQRGANVNTANNIGSTSLINAAYYGYEDMVKLLLQHGADHSHGTAVDNTALYWASKKGFHNIAKMLLDAGANPFHSTQNGTSVLYTGKDESMKRLIREYQRVDGPAWLVRELSAHGLKWSVVCDTQDKLRKIGSDTKDSLARSSLGDSYLKSIGIDETNVRYALLQIFYSVNGSSGSWLIQELSKRVAQWNLVSDVLHKLRSVGLDSRESLLRIPSARFTDAYLQDIGIVILALRCTLLEVRAQATWLGARLASEGVTVSNLFLSESFVYDTLGCTTEASFAALSESDIQARTSHLSVGVRQSLLNLYTHLQAAPSAIAAPVTTPAATQMQGQAPAQAQEDTSASFVPQTETEDRAMFNTVVKVKNAGMAEVNGDSSLPHSTSASDGDAARDAEGEQQRDSEEGEFMMVGSQK